MKFSFIFFIRGGLYHHTLKFFVHSVTVNADSINSGSFCIGDKQKGKGSNESPYHVLKIKKGAVQSLLHLPRVIKYLSIKSLSSPVLFASGYRFGHRHLLFHPLGIV